MLKDDINEVLDAIYSMKNKKISQNTTLWLSYDLLDYYEEFKKEILYHLGNNASIYINNTVDNIYYVVFKFDDMYFPIYPLSDLDPDQVMNISCRMSVEEFDDILEMY